MATLAEAEDARVRQLGIGAIPDEYGKIVELHKFYLELGTKAAAGSLTVIGAILAYVSENGLPVRAVPLTLAVPLVLSIGNTLVFTTGAYFAVGFVSQVRVAQARVGAHWRPHVEFLLALAVVGACLFFALTIVLVWILSAPQLVAASKAN
jgi:hypothetical protein